MDAPRAVTRALTRRIAIETPENVVIELELAGVGSRFAAAVTDMMLMIALYVGAIILYAAVTGSAAGNWPGALFLLLAFAVLWGYFALFEALMNGQTPGKRGVGLRVVMDTGHPLTVSAALTRNLLRIVDSQPFFFYLVGSIFIFAHPLHQRLGDIVAGTIVVRDRPASERVVQRTAAAPARIVADTPELSDEEFRLLEQFLARRDQFDGAVRQRVAQGLLRRLAERLPPESRGFESRLEALFEAERARRGGALSGTRTAGGATARFIARKQDGWEAFRTDALRAEKEGLRNMGGDALTAFAARYREAAADLARARTYGVEAGVIAYLERAVSAGHNALYGLRGVTRVPLRRLVIHDLPAAVWNAKRYVIAAFLLTLIPGVFAWLLIREQPSWAADLLPAEMIARAEAGVTQARNGVGYAQMPSPFLPIMASSIIANNVQVAFAAFAFGITAGLGTVFVLVFNGLSVGSVIGLFQNYGLAGWLLTFMAGHGVLELTAIFIAGAAGLRIAHALLAPGDLTRRAALVLAGRQAILLLGFATFLLLLAGSIEGLLSASDAAPTVKLGVSAASALLLVLFALAGKRQSASPRPGAA